MGKRVGMISLGCAKNLVDSEQMLWLLDEAGYDITPDIENTDVVIINTCGFIESAKAEAIENVLEVGALKKEGKVGKIVLAGCLAERYRDEILRELPEVDALVGCGCFGEIVTAVDQAMEGKTPQLFGPLDAPICERGRVISTPPYTAYLKIAEGCDNRCSYCVIPSLRGPYRSRKMEDILEEASALCQSGTKELIVVAQDISRYGTDLYGKRQLGQLLEQLCKIPELQWIRLHYLYPDEIDDALLQTIQREDKILKYLDIPLQHINDRLLKAMNRRGTSQEIRALLEKIRRMIPGVVLRSSFIVGFPGETEEEFTELCQFLKDVKIERAGVFPYSAEEGSVAAAMPDQIDEKTKHRRADRVMEIQQKVMDAYNRRQIGKELQILCEGYDRFAECWYGRSFADSPEIDGKVFFTGKGIHAGELVTVKINGQMGDDLQGEVKR